MNGLNQIAVDFCACEHVGTYGLMRQQLLRHRLFPATIDQPQTCSTFSLLEHYRMQALQSKITMYDYYMALEKLTENRGFASVPVGLIFHPEPDANDSSLEALQGVRTDDSSVQIPYSPEARWQGTHSIWNLGYG